MKQGKETKCNQSRREWEREIGWLVGNGEFLHSAKRPKDHVSNMVKTAKSESLQAIYFVDLHIYDVAVRSYSWLICVSRAFVCKCMCVYLQAIGFSSSLHQNDFSYVYMLYVVVVWSILFLLLLLLLLLFEGQITKWWYFDQDSLSLSSLNTHTNLHNSLPLCLCWRCDDAIKSNKPNKTKQNEKKGKNKLIERRIIITTQIHNSRKQRATIK